MEKALAKLVSGILEIGGGWILVILVVAIVAINFIAKKIVNYKRRDRVNYEGDEEEYEIYRHPTDELRPDQYRKVIMGAVMTQINEAYIDTLTTGLSKESLDNLTGDWWGIYSHDEAIDVLDRLENKGFRYYFPAIYKAFIAGDESKEKEIIAEEISGRSVVTSQNEADQVSSDIYQAIRLLHNLKTAYKVLLEYDIVESKEDVGKYTNSAFDYVRLCFVARFCFDAGFISEQEAWYYIDQAYIRAKEQFDSWHDYGHSFMVGRVFWAGDREDNELMFYHAFHLMSEEDSPWNEVSW